MVNMLFMLKMFKSLELVIFLLFGFLGKFNCFPVEVVISNGTVIGESFLSKNNVRVNQFLGIPYAKPPVGKLRFHRPQSPEPWNKPLNATKPPKDCAGQGIFSFNPKSEDCLYLNIWSPNIIKTNKKENQLKPVLFWIHGGSLIVGSGMDYFSKDSSLLATMADCVVVTINYRLSIFGFLYSNDVPDIRGNQGLWDQTQALRWVVENIDRFGGDPTKITVIGHSAGSWSLSTLIISPISRNLFQNAIMLSGGNTYGVVESDPAKLITRQLTGIRDVDCATENDTTINAQIIECLQQVKAEELVDIYTTYREKLNIPDTVFDSLVVVDGEFLPASPQSMLASRNHKQNFNLLVGTVENEGMLIVAVRSNDSRIRQQGKPEAITLDEASSLLYQISMDHFPMPPISKEKIRRTYFNGMHASHDNANLFRKTVGVAFGDFLLTCPTLGFAKSLVRSDSNSIRVFQLYYTAQVSGRTWERYSAEWAGVCHFDSLLPLFGLPFRNPDAYSNREREISREFMNIIKAFLRNGTPGEDQREWQSYFVNSDNKTVVAPYYHLEYHPKSHESFKFDLKQAECQLWSEYY